MKTNQPTPQSTHLLTHLMIQLNHWRSHLNGSGGPISGQGPGNKSSIPASAGSVK